MSMEPFGVAGAIGQIKPARSRYEGDADRIVRMLVGELAKQNAWVDVIAIGDAIRQVRVHQQSLEREARHLSGEEPFPQTGQSSAPLTPGAPPEARS